MCARSPIRIADCRLNGARASTTVFYTGVMTFRLQRVMRVRSRAELDEDRERLEYWLTRPPEERLAALECLRRQWVEPGTRLQRVLRIVDRERR